MNVISWVKNLLGQFKWYRERETGHWELWELPGGRGSAWLHVSGCFHFRGRGPDPRLHGRPIACEHYWPESCSYADVYDLELRPAFAHCPVCRKRVDQHQTDPCFKEVNPLVTRLCTGQLVIKS